MLIHFSEIHTKYSMDVKGVVHIGAHYGEELIDYVNRGVQEMVLFEPLSCNWNVLREKSKDINANIQAHNVALGSEVGTATMYISSNSAQSSSILKPKQHLELHPDVSFEGSEDVEVDILDNYDIGNCNMINMDVQGYELEVFKGAKKTLEKIDYIYCEVNRDEVYEGNAMVEELDEFLSDFEFERVETKWPETYYTWGDALYIKKK